MTECAWGRWGGGGGGGVLVGSWGREGLGVGWNRWVMEVGRVEVVVVGVVVLLEGRKELGIFCSGGEKGGGG